MAYKKLLLFGLTLWLTVSLSNGSEVNKGRLNSLSTRLIRALAGEARENRFVGQLATDCGMNCAKEKRELKPEARELQGAPKKRFMALGAEDCGDFMCVLRRRLAMEKMRRFLKDKREASESRDLVRSHSSERRHKRYIDILFGDPYSQGSDYNSDPLGDNNYGSYGWENNYYDYDRYYNDYNDYYDDYEDDVTSGSGSGSGSGDGYNADTE